MNTKPGESRGRWCASFMVNITERSSRSSPRVTAPLFAKLFFHDIFTWAIMLTWTIRFRRCLPHRCWREDRARKFHRGVPTNPRSLRSKFRNGFGERCRTKDVKIKGSCTMQGCTKIRRFSNSIFTMNRSIGSFDWLNGAEIFNGLFGRRSEHFPSFLGKPFYFSHSSCISC